MRDPDKAGSFFVNRMPSACTLTLWPRYDEPRKNQIAMNTSTQSELNKWMCRRFFQELHNNRNLAIIEELVDRNVVSHDPFPGQKPGRDGMRDTITLFHDAFPDMHVEIRDMLAENDRVMTRLRISGTHEGSFMEAMPTHNAVIYEEVIILRIDHGKIVEHWAVADTLSLMQGIGIAAKEY
jgi:predicted ester cyclase